MTASSLSRAERRRIRRLHSPKLARIDDGDARFFQRHPARYNRVRLAGRAEIEAASLKEVAALLGTEPGVRFAAAVRRIAPGANVKLLFPTRDREDVDVSEREAAAVFDFLSALKSDDVRIVSSYLMDQAVRVGGFE